MGGRTSSYEQWLAGAEIRHEKSEIRKAKAERARICAEAMAGIDDPVGTVARLNEIMRHIAGLCKHADNVVGFVGNPHMKALNKAGELADEARALLSRIGGGE